MVGTPGTHKGKPSGLVGRTFGTSKKVEEARQEPGEDQTTGTGRRRKTQCEFQERRSQADSRGNRGSKPRHLVFSRSHGKYGSKKEIVIPRDRSPELNRHPDRHGHR